MATPSPYPLPLSGDPLVDATTHGYYWELGESKTINWSLSDNISENLYWVNPTLDGGLGSRIDEIFDALSYYIDVEFNYVGYWDDPRTAATKGSDINISMSSWLFNSPNALAMAFFPNASEDTNWYQGASGDIFINVDSQANAYESYGPGSQGWFLLLHEIGHALGLKHPHDDGGTGSPTLNEIGLAGLNYDWASIMSYEDDYNYSLLAYDPATPMFLDVVGLQYLYGANNSVNAGDGVFSLSKNNQYQTYWDPSGSDTIDAASVGEGWHIYLDIEGDVAAGFAVPSAEINLASPLTLYWLMGDIENVGGSRYDDTIVGNELNNLIFGNQGDDFLNGGLGIDTAYYTGNKADYRLSRGKVSDVIVGADGVDELHSIERLRFSDGLVALDINGNAGKVLKLLGAIFGGQSIYNEEYVGIGLDLFDAGQTMEQVSTVALRAAGVNSDEAVVDLLYTNLYGETPQAADQSHYVALLENGTYTHSTLGVAAAELVDTFGVIDLVGISQTGIDYI